MADNETPAEGQKGVKERRANNVAPHETERFGNVVAKIFANQGPLNQVVFKLELVRLYSSPNGVGETHTFEFLDIMDAIRAADWARKRIKVIEKRIRRGIVLVSFK